MTCARHQLHLKTLLPIEKFTSLVPSRNVILQYIIQFDCLQGVEKKKNFKCLAPKVVMVTQGGCLQGSKYSDSTCFEKLVPEEK